MPTTYPDSSTLTDTAWPPLACLVQQLQFLSDFLHAGPGSFPPCLLEALLQYQPRCRLHVFTFRLRSLHLPETDPDELALATAPCLHSIWVWYKDGLDDDDQPDYHSEAVESMVKGLAPNLKEVHLFREPSNHDLNGNPLPCAPWKGFTNVRTGTFLPAQLESLELGLDLGTTVPRLALNKEVVDSGTENTNLSFLRVLKLSRAVSQRVLWLIQAKSFPFTCAEDQEHEYYNNVRQFIHSLPQLTSLEVIAWPPNISLAGALPAGLREFWLRTQDGFGLDEATILELVARCPHIETLALKIHRHRGNTVEVALYKALGLFANLRRLVLTLDTSPLPPIVPSH